MLLQIQGHHLPGRVWQTRDEHHDNIHVGIQVGREPRELVRGDAEYDVVGDPDRSCCSRGCAGFPRRGGAGQAGARFVYLTWGDVDEVGSFTMFRRAKLMLADLEPFVTETRRYTGHRTGGPHRRVRRAAVRPAQAARVDRREADD